jgi:hypothetical protein
LWGVGRRTAWWPWAVAGGWNGRYGTFTGDDSLAIHDLLIGDVLDVRVSGDVALFVVVRMKLAE